MRVRKFCYSAILLLFFTFLCYLFIFSPVKFSDFVSERVSFLDDKYKRFEKNIVVDVTLLRAPGGMATYSKEVIDFLIKERPNYLWIIVGDTDFSSEFLSFYKRFPNVVLLEARSPFAWIFEGIYVLGKFKFFKCVDSKFSKWLSKQSAEFNDKFYRIKQAILFDRIFIDRHTDLIFSLMTPEPHFSFGIPQVSIVHDVIQCDGLEFVPLFQKHLYGAMYANNFNSSKKIIAISNFTKSSILRNFEGISPDRIEVVLTQMANRFPQVSLEKQIYLLNKFGISKNKYCVFASTFWGHKNHKGLVEAFGKMLENYKVDNEFKLVLMGAINSYTSSEIFSLVKKLNLQKRIVFTGYTNNEEFFSIMKNALFAVNPTFYEGFGMPIAEAMLMEKPVTCSGIASLPEIGGDAALYFDPYNTDDIAEKMYTIYSDENLRKQLIEKGIGQVAKFTNKQKMLHDMLDLLERTMAETDKQNPYKIGWEFCHTK